MYLAIIIIVLASIIYLFARVFVTVIDRFAQDMTEEEQTEFIKQINQVFYNSNQLL